MYHRAHGMRCVFGFDITTAETHGLPHNNIDMGLGISYGWPCRACGTWHIDMKPCSGRKWTRYCSGICQKSDWKRNKLESKEIAETILPQKDAFGKPRHTRFGVIASYTA